LKKKSIVPSFITTPKIEDFQIIKHLGEGRFGAVSMAIHRKLGLLVALKKVKKSVIKAHKI
jgi:serine/threonine protein kinase